MDLPPTYRYDESAIAAALRARLPESLHGQVTREHTDPDVFRNNVAFEHLDLDHLGHSEEHVLRTTVQQIKDQAAY